MKKYDKKKIKVSFIDSMSSEEVTGSMIYVETPNHKMLLDCGIFQSNNLKNDYLTNNRSYKEFKPKDITEIFCTHLHGDHCLLLPVLYKRGCSCNTYMPDKSLKILKVMLDDSAYINTRDSETLGRIFKKHYEPTYTKNDVENCMEHINEIDVDTLVYVDDELSYKFLYSGHIPFACQLILYITVNSVTKKIVLTGDLGNLNIQQDFTQKFEKIDKTNLLIAECTYSGKPDIKMNQKERENDIAKMESIINERVVNGHGKLVIPVFAQTRAQVIAYQIYKLFKDKDFRYKVYVDSPLSIKIFRLYEELLDGEEKDKFMSMLDWENLIFVEDAKDSIALVDSCEPCVILASSGMANSGRVIHHIKSIIDDKNATMLFCGYSSPNTLSYKIKEGKQKTVRIENKVYRIKCECYNLKSFSSHISYDSMLELYSSIKADTIILHHGNMKEKIEFSKELKNTLERNNSTTNVKISNKSFIFKM